MIPRICFKTQVLFCILVYFSVCIPKAFGAGSHGVRVNDLFQVKSGTNKGGFDKYLGVLQLWLDDTMTLVDFVVEALPDVSNDGSPLSSNQAFPAGQLNDPLKSNLQSWFGIKSKKANSVYRNDVNSYRSIKEHFTKLQRFLKQQDGEWLGEKKPWIFYNSDWMERTEVCYNEDGEPVDENYRPIKKAEEHTTQPANLRTWHPPPGVDIDSVFQDLLDKMKLRSSGNWDNYAYWSSDIKDYGIIPAVEVYRPGGFCDAGSDVNFFALTMTNMLQDSITLCPPAFTEVAEKWETIDEGLKASNAQGNIELQDTSPRSLTLFHELIHMTSGVEETTDSGTKPLECLSLVKYKKFPEARQNPDSLVYFVWSYYLEMKGSPPHKWNTGIRV